MFEVLSEWIGRACSSSAVDSEKPALKGVCGLELGVDACGEGWEIRVNGAHDDAGVIRMVAMEPDEVLAVVGEDGALIGTGEAQHLVIRDGVVGLTGVQRSKHVVTQFAQGGDDRKREVLVGIKSCGHESSALAAISRSISSRWLRA